MFNDRSTSSVSKLRKEKVLLLAFTIELNLLYLLIHCRCLWHGSGGVWHLCSSDSFWRAMHYFFKLSGPTKSYHFLFTMYFFCSCWVSFTNNLVWAFAAPVLLICLVKLFVICVCEFNYSYPFQLKLIACSSLSYQTLHQLI